MRLLPVWITTMSGCAFVGRSAAASGRLPSTGGVLRTPIEDFEVEEIPSYLPSGPGAHAYAFIEKRGLTTRDVVDAIVEAGAPRGSVGFAGQKDKYAVARQWISVPAEQEAALKSLDDVEGVRVLEASCTAISWVWDT